ncbi:aldo/keto reductase [Porcipelethomonas sp.]|uniref:aldo/keto reductase n=1 Tax=Porcipelethomonas sp. TaxID=2981675 RepID=UPI003EF8A191
MKYIKNIQDVRISKIGLGTGRFGTKVSESLSFDMLDLFYEGGGTLIDTARNYYEWVENGRGKSEECIGKWMDSRGCRRNVCISTKCGVKNKGHDWFINLSKEMLSQELEESLEALRTDYIDIYLLHRDEPERPVEEIIETMQYLKEKGKVKIIGAANWSFERLYKANEYAKKHGMEPFRTVQTWWSLAEYKYEMWNDSNTTHMDENMYNYMINNNMFGMAYTSQCKGFFQKAVKNGLENVDEFLKHRIETERNLKKLDFIKKYCQGNNVSPTSVVSGYITSNPLEGTALVSCSDMSQLEDILRCCDYELEHEAISKLDSL